MTIYHTFLITVNDEDKTNTENIEEYVEVNDEVEKNLQYGPGEYMGQSNNFVDLHQGDLCGVNR